VTRCVEFSEDEINGYEVLQHSGLDLNVDVSSSMGAAICRLDGEGCTYPEEECFCQCQGSPCIFWSYWHLDGDSWVFSNLGASNYKVSHGQVEGWAWGEGSSDGDGIKPPVRKFEEICEVPPTNTPTATPTHTSQPTDTPTSTPTPKPTNTPEPKEKPVIHHFSANQTTIAAGQSVQLSWDLSGAEAAYLRYNGIEEGVIAPGSKTVSPTESIVYTLVTKNEGGETTAQVTVTVDDVPAPSTSTPPPAPTATPATAAASSVSSSATSIPEPVINFTAASLTLPQGACTNVQWSVQQAETLFLDDNPVEMQGTQQACPTQSQTFRLRAVYPGGEKVAELTLTVTDAQVPPTGPPSPAVIVSEAEIQTTLFPATPAAVVVSPAAEAGTPAGPRRFTVPTESGDSNSTGIWWAGAAVAALGLFVIVPVALIVMGWIVWWLKGKNR
jgi:hypothetical protein